MLLVAWLVRSVGLLLKLLVVVDGEIAAATFPELCFVGFQSTEDRVLVQASLVRHRGEIRVHVCVMRETRLVVGRNTAAPAHVEVRLRRRRALLRR